MTERLYARDPYLVRFTGRVRSCTAEKRGFAVVLNRTAFYPEGGGQPGDRGTLGPARVTDTQETGGEVVHFCDAPLDEGAEVEGLLDWDRRFDLMQQHSGEHIVSGLICARFGCDNVGFHLGAEVTVIDFNHPVSPEELGEIELEANRVIWEDRPFLVSHPAPEELKRLPYRSKKELHGDVRIVECPGADCCACCGTHVARAGALGLIKLLSVKPFREGARIELLAGKRAYAYVRMAAAQNHAVSVLTSAKETGTAAAVERLKAELAAEKYRAVGLENRLFERIAKEYAGRGDTLLFADMPHTPDALRRLCELVCASCGGICAVFSGGDDMGYQYAVGSAEGSVREQVNAMNAALNGRGGGKQAGFAQGSLRASRAEIENWFE